jgi:CHAT domain-containing protein
VTAVVLCPDAALAAVPFAALPGREAGRFWIDDYRFRHVSMAQDLVPWPGGVTSRKGALLVGAVDYGRASAGGAPGGPGLDRAPRGMTFIALPGTGAEVAFLATRLGAGSAAVVGAEATEARIRAEASARSIFHFATHGFVRDDLMAGLRDRSIEGGAGGADAEARLSQGHDPMLLSGLAMAGANARAGGGDDDGIMTALEASRLDLDGAALVTLSACETARGQAESGEGVLGLVRAFGMAGAERVVGSLWRVDDEATRVLMERFYGAMLREKNPLAPADALREAALEVRAARGSDGRSFAAPRIWAAFVCYGR